MFLKNVVVDATDPATLGRFWECLLDATTLTDAEDAYETRPVVPDGPVLGLRFPRGSEPVVLRSRPHLDVVGGARQHAVVQHAPELGATPLDVGQRDGTWVVLADPDGHPFCLLPARRG